MQGRQAAPLSEPVTAGSSACPACQAAVPDAAVICPDCFRFLRPASGTATSRASRQRGDAEPDDGVESAAPSPGRAQVEPASPYTLRRREVASAPAPAPAPAPPSDAGPPSAPALGYLPEPARPSAFDDYVHPDLHAQWQRRPAALAIWVCAVLVVAVAAAGVFSYLR